MVARAKPAPKKTVSLTTKDYIIYCCADHHLHIDMLDEFGEPTLQLSFDDTEAYEFAQGILRGYDVLNGIAPGQQQD